jgi:flagellar hook-associated protein 1 FlgK
VSNLLNNGASGLIAFQRALATTSHNIANVNTEGYSRQRVDLEASTIDHRLPHQAGNGVHVAGIERLQDQFAAARVTQATSDYSQQATHHAMASQLDNLMADDALSMTPVMNEFFGALQDASSDPASTASREVVLAKAGQLADRFRSLQQQLDDTQNEVNGRLRDSVDTINEISTAIADVNKRIVASHGHMQGRAANDLLDQRDQLVVKLSEHVNVRVLDQEDGALNVFIGNGVGLVVGNRSHSLRTVVDDTSPDRVQIEIGHNDQWQVIGPRLQGGAISGLQDFETNTLNPAMHQLGRLALNLSDQFNTQHIQGLDLDGNPGGELFTSSAPRATSSSSNTGNGALAVTIDNTSILQGSDYLLRYDGANFLATRQSDGMEVTGATPLSIDGLTINLTGTPAAGDTFLVSATGRAAAFIEFSVSDTNALALAGPLSTSSSVANPGEAKISSTQTLDIADPAFNNPVDIVFTADNTFDVIDTNSGTSLATGVAYTAGTPIQFNGWEVTINGSAKNGDVHKIEPNVNGRGNNTNGLALINLQTERLIDGNKSLNDTYSALVSRVGGQTSSLQTRTNALETLHKDAIERQQATQGVNLDEEAINLARFQQAYQASAQVIATADTLFQTLLRAVAR